VIGVIHDALKITRRSEGFSVTSPKTANADDLNYDKPPGGGPICLVQRYSTWLSV
jgi:hypothetical protein